MYVHLLSGDGSKPWYLVNPKIAGKWMFIPLKMVLIGIDPYPSFIHIHSIIFQAITSNRRVVKRVQGGPKLGTVPGVGSQVHLGL